VDHRGKPSSTQEIHILKKVVERLNPKTNAEWKDVCMQMHGEGSRRRPSEYRTKYEAN
jgi:hypothetical protein